MRSVMTSAISLGLVIIPCKLYATASAKDAVKFHFMCPEHQTRIVQKKFCSGYGEEITAPVKGYEYEKNKYVIFTEEELQQLEEDNKAIDIVEFVPTDEISPLFFSTHYYVVPEEVGLRPYSLLVENLKTNNLSAITQFVMRDKQKTAALHLVDRDLILSTLHHSYEMNAGFAIPLSNTSEKETMLMGQLVDSLTNEVFDLSNYKDNTKIKIEALVAQKLTGIQVTRLEKKSLQDSLEALLAKSIKS